VIELELGNKADLEEIASNSKREKLKGNQNAAKEKTVLSQNDNTVSPEPAPKVNTQKEIAKAAGVSTGQQTHKASFHRWKSGCTLCTMWRRPPEAEGKRAG